MFKKIVSSMVFVCAGLLIVSAVFTACGGSKNKGAGETLTAGDGPGDTGNGTQDIPSSSTDGLHPLFQGKLGVPVSKMSLGAVLNDKGTNLTLADDLTVFPTTRRPLPANT